MADPRGNDLGDWALTVLAGLVIGVLTAVGTIVGWFRHTNEETNQRITDLECEMNRRSDKRSEEAKDMWKIHSEHEAQLRQLRACQDNTAETLAALKDDTRDINQKLDAILMNNHRGSGQ